MGMVVFPKAHSFGLLVWVNIAEDPLIAPLPTLSLQSPSFSQILGEQGQALRREQKTLAYASVSLKLNLLVLLDPNFFKTSSAHFLDVY